MLYEEVEKLHSLSVSDLQTQKSIFKNGKNDTKFYARAKQTNYKNILKIPISQLSFALGFIQKNIKKIAPVRLFEIWKTFFFFNFFPKKFHFFHH